MSGVSQLGKIGQNSVNEIFEDLTYNVAYTEILQRLDSFIDLDNNALKEALKSGSSLFVTSALFLYIQKQEEVITKIMSYVGSALVFYISPIRDLLINKIKKLKGRRLSKFMDFFSNSSSDNINMSRLSVELGTSVFNAQMSSTSQANLIVPTIMKHSQMIQSESHKLNYARAKTQSINETLLFKLFTSKFTEQDKQMLKRITGNQKIDIESINQVSEFMFVTDDAGNIRGLSEQFLTMLNGLGYTQNKKKKGV